MIKYPVSVIWHCPFERLTIIQKSSSFICTTHIAGAFSLDVLTIMAMLGYWKMLPTRRSATVLPFWRVFRSKESYINLNQSIKQLDSKDFSVLQKSMFTINSILSRPAYLRRAYHRLKCSKQLVYRRTSHRINQVLRVQSQHRPRQQ